MNSITITYGSTTQSLQDWGFTNCQLHLRSRAPSTLVLDTAGGDPAALAAFDYGVWIMVAISLGDGGTYYFYGKRRRFDARAYPGQARTAMQLEDVWGSLMRTTFQHYWSMSDGSGGLEYKYFSRLNLFQNITAGPDSVWTYLPANAQIEQIIDFAQTQCSVPVQYGEIDPVWNLPVFAVKNISCAEAIQYVLKPMPDMVTCVDNSTTLDGSPCPTINFYQRQNCTPVTLPFAGTDANGRSHSSSDITPRPDLQVPSVNIQYQIYGTYDGSAYDDLGYDNYPLDSTGLEENALVFAVDLRGPSNTLVKATLHTVAIDPATTDFWQTNKPDLDDPNIVLSGTTTQGFVIVDTTINGGTSLHPDGIQILDSNGDPVTLSDYPNKLLPSGGNPAPWMKNGSGATITGIPVTIRATLKYDQRSPNSASKLDQNDRHVVETRITLTNADAGTNTYTTVGSESSGDPIPTSLAYFMWCSINNIVVNYVDGTASPPETAPSLTAPENLQWEGQHTIVEDTIYSIITPANTLNLSGGNSDWAEMNAAIYAVDIDFFEGRTVVQFGPHKHLQAAEYFEMVMAFRYRSVYDNPQLRNNGNSGSAGGTDLGAQQAKENTTHQNAQKSQHTVESPPDPSSDNDVVQIKEDANTNGGQFVIQTLSSSGTVQTDQPQVQLTQDDLGVDEDTGDGNVAKWRNWTDGDGNTIKVAATADATIGGTNIQWGKLNVVDGNPEIYANYFVVNTGSVSTTCALTVSYPPGTTTFTVTDATGIEVGDIISGTSIPGGTSVTGISGTTITMSAASTGAIIEGDTYTFTGLIRVAKIAKLRCSITSETIDGNTFSYAYGAGSPYTYVSRLATATVDGEDIAEYQVIVPRFLGATQETADEVWFRPVDNEDIGSIVSVTDSVGPSGEAIVFIDDQDRKWCAAVDQTGYEGEDDGGD